jgi:hypothetical protein
MTLLIDWCLTKSMFINYLHTSVSVVFLTFPSRKYFVATGPTFTDENALVLLPSRQEPGRSLTGRIATPRPQPSRNGNGSGNGNVLTALRHWQQHRIQVIRGWRESAVLAALRPSQIQPSLRRYQLQNTAQDFKCS